VARQWFRVPRSVIVTRRVGSKVQVVTLHLFEDGLGLARLRGRPPMRFAKLFDSLDAAERGAEARPMAASRRVSVVDM
jgi:hypothetical protein